LPRRSCSALARAFHIESRSLWLAKRGEIVMREQSPERNAEADAEAEERQRVLRMLRQQGRAA
jgi:hypothetical protein